MKPTNLFSGNKTDQKADNTADPEIKMLQVGSHTVRVLTAGTQHISSGTPTVVFENGLGSDIEDWGSLLERVSEFAPVIAYDRPGIGESKESDFDPSPTNVSSLLKEILGLVDAKPPYILVGFSLGGPYSRMHAASLADDVAGAVYIDPMDFTQTKQTRLEEFGQFGKGPEVLAEYDRVLQSHLEGIHSGQSFLEWQQAFTFIQEGFSEFNKVAPAISAPQIILCSARQPIPLGEYSFDFGAWAELSTQSRIARLMSWATALDEGYFVVTPASPHKIHGDDPDLVVWAIKRVMFPDPAPRLAEVLLEQGEKDFIDEYHRLKAIYPEERFGEDLLNDLGYRILYTHNKPQEALSVFQLNVAEYPEAANPADSLGECYLVLGEKELAIKYYARSLELDPGNANAENKLKELKA